MKLVLFVWVFTCLTISLNASSPFDDLSPFDKADLAYIRDFQRSKRSGSSSGDILQHLKTSIGQGIKSKLSQLAKSSAGASSHFSSSSSSSHHQPHYYHDDGYKPDAYSLKKSIFATLLQALKAIKGGVIAIKGQILKGGGHLLSAKGKLITGGGEALSNIGKNIATSAFAQHHEEESHSGPAHYEQAPSGYGHSAPGPSYNPPSGPSYHTAPSGPAPEYGPPDYHKQQYTSAYAEGKHDGIVILKKIPSGPGHETHDAHVAHEAHENHETHEAHESKTPEFKPLPEADPMHNLVNSVFTASFPFTLHNQPTAAASQQSIQKIPSTNYGTPVGAPVKYQDYFNSANTIHLNDQKNVKMYVTPAPESLPLIYNLPAQNFQSQIQQKPNQDYLNYPNFPNDKPHLFIGMNVPLEDSLDYLPRYNPEEHFQQNPAQFSEQQVPTKFLINYPDPIEIKKRTPHRPILRKAPIILNPLPSQSTHLSPVSPLAHAIKHKAKPNFEILRSVAFELGPHGPTKI